jgi:hypothetical protein
MEFPALQRRWPRRCACWWWVTLRPPGSGEHQEQALAQPLARQLAARTGHPVAWQLVAQSGVNSLEALDLLGRHEIGPATVRWWPWA